MRACHQIHTLNPPIQSSQVTGLKPTQEYQFKLKQKWNMIIKKPCPSTKRSLQYPPSSPHLLHWTLSGNRNKYQKEMNEFLFKGSFSPHFSEILLYLHFKLIIFQLRCHNNSLATDPDEKSQDFCNSYLLCFFFALTHEMKFAFCMDRTTQSLRKSNLFKKKNLQSFWITQILNWV